MGKVQPQKQTLIVGKLYRYYSLDIMINPFVVLVYDIINDKKIYYYDFEKKRTAMMDLEFFDLSSNFEIIT